MAENRYKKLMGNTMIFAIGQFSSKLLVFLMMPFYTNILNTSEYGIVDAIINFAQILIPFACAGIYNGVIRFGLDKEYDKTSVYTTGLYVTMGGFIVLALVSPIFNLIAFLDGYVLTVLMYVLMSNFRRLNLEMSRSLGYNKTYAANGVANTFLFVVLNILFLAVFRWGVMGYVLANVCADAITGTFIFFQLKMYRYIARPARINKRTARSIIGYSLPLIPTTVCNWIISMSDRYMLIYFIDTSANGLYAAAHKIPTILTIVATIFTDAWQISAVTEDRDKLESFYSNVMAAFSSVAFILSSGIVFTAKLGITLLAADSYYEAWMYIPVLALSTTFALLAQYLATVYMVAKKTIMTMWTTAFGAALNVIFNAIFIPICGIQGAAIGTCLSYIALFAIRVVHTRKYIKIKWNVPKFAANFAILLVQTLVMLAEPQFWIAIELVLFALLCLINLREMLLTARQVLSRRRKRH